MGRSKILFSVAMGSVFVGLIVSILVLPTSGGRISPQLCRIWQPSDLRLDSQSWAKDLSGSIRTSGNGIQTFKVLLTVEPKLELSEYTEFFAEIVTERKIRPSLVWRSIRDGAAIKSELLFDLSEDDRISKVNLSNQPGWTGVTTAIELTFSNAVGQIAVGKIALCPSGLVTRIAIAIEGFFATVWIGDRHLNFVRLPMADNSMSRHMFFSVLFLGIFAGIVLLFSERRKRMVFSTFAFVLLWVLADLTWVFSITQNLRLTLSQAWERAKSPNVSLTEGSSAAELVRKLRSTYAIDRSTAILLAPAMGEITQYRVRFHFLPARVKVEDRNPAVNELFVFPVSSKHIVTGNAVERMTYVGAEEFNVRRLTNAGELIAVVRVE